MRCPRSRGRKAQMAKRVRGLNEAKLTAVYQAIVAHVETHGYPPTVREIGLAVGLAPATVHQWLEQLEAIGWITRVEGKPRAIRLTKD